MLGIGLVIGLVCGGTICGICVHLWHLRHVPPISEERSDKEVREHEEAMSQPVTMAPEATEPERIGVHTAVTRIMQKRGYPTHEEAEIADAKAAARHRADTRAIKVIHQD